MRFMALSSPVTCALIAVACTSEPSPRAPAPGEGGDDASALAATDSVVAWATDIRQGISSLAVQVGSDPAAAKKRAIELYITRQERIEQTVGPGTGSAEELAGPVHEAEARFHELMQVLGESPPPDSTRVAAAVEALDARLAEVLDLVGGTGAGGDR
jgi:hypothetical protein